MTRLYLRIYAAFLAIVVAFFLLSSMLWWHGRGGPREHDLLRGVSSVADLLIPPADAPSGMIEARLEQLRSASKLSLALFGADGSPTAAVGVPLRPPEFARQKSYRLRQHRRGNSVALRLSDGRWLVALAGPDRGPGLDWLPALALMAGVIAIGAYPVARGITRRIERLTARVDELGAGDLRARAPVEGKDEVARLAERFNRAADRIEGLVSAQRNLLASTSHALRSPLARLRMAAELLGERGEPRLREQMQRDIAELNSAVEELLVVSRLDLLDPNSHHEEVDFLALVAEEAARVGGDVEGEPALVRGDSRSLRHLVRNLLENARRHAPDSPVEVRVRGLATGGAQLEVSDRGRGIPDAERERIFQPFTRLPAAPGEGGGGVGLGLAIVQQIARHHGGAARVYAREGGGSCFEVTLPGRSRGAL